MKAEIIKSIPAGENPFLHDLDNMGTKVAKNVMIMHRSHPHEKAEFIIIVNQETGQRMKVTL